MRVERRAPLARRYRLLVPVGRGGTGTVWHAYDETLDREVAIKEVRLPASLTPRERRMLCRRLIDEARATAALRHPGVVAVHDVVVEDGRPWVVMEYLKARSLHRLLSEDGPVPPARAAEIGAAVLSVLRAAHAAGILHRDVKPSNVLLCDDGRVLLTDFGLAVPLHRGREVVDTIVAGVEGSPAYLPPERVRGHPGVPASDLWSLGATLYAAVEGVPPFLRCHALASMLAVLLGDCRPPRRAGALGPVITALLREDPAERPHPAVLAATLERIAGSGASRFASRAMVPYARRGLLRRRRPRASRAGAVTGVAALAGMVVVLGMWSARWNSVGQSDALLLTPAPDATDRTVTYHGPGYRVDVPADWRRSHHGGVVVWDDPDSTRELRIARVTGDALVGLEAAEREAGRDRTYPGYRRLRLEAAPHLAPGAAEWEYVWTGPRGERDGAHGLRSRTAGYEITFHAPDERWTPGQRLYDRVLSTLRPEHDS
ncbi:serine/threonine-protein kinase [Actinomadura namibiensis]|uniref:non-specific serine/threonine protein kinase n=1 Tax=Actinomadura namibiensis TaxID=182080 RepID=A0A7W3QL99_ACTNM|nr:serine/threonine-protein kinase [Actinomadura namibiensis]MBA8950758.1 tRNA A-37 threonylcarbamoyl transferase component Bud32 [Actinomadura namibiensis]